MHSIYIEAQFQLSQKARNLSDPTGYEVHFYQPAMKGAGDVLSLVSNHEIILIAIQQIGLLDWVVSESYSVLWDYLTSHLSAEKGTTSTIKIKDSSGQLRAEFSGVTQETLQNAKITLENEVKSDPDGTKVSKERIEIDFSKKKK
jgi:hypothetical protein